MSGDVVVTVPSGLSPIPARQLAGQARQFVCTATLTNGRGAVADARNLFQLLRLGAGVGERVTIRCVGAEAQAAYEVIANILLGREVT